jgi:hypothetical protein
MHAISWEKYVANWLMRDGFEYLPTGPKPAGDILNRVAKQDIQELLNTNHHAYCSPHLDKNR